MRVILSLSVLLTIIATTAHSQELSDADLQAAAKACDKHSNKPKLHEVEIKNPKTGEITKMQKPVFGWEEGYEKCGPVISEVNARKAASATQDKLDKDLIEKVTGMIK